MRGLLAVLSARSVVGVIVLVGIVAWSFLLTGAWPSEWLIVGASLGGLASTFFWGLIRKVRGEPPKE